MRRIFATPPSGARAPQRPLYRSSRLKRGNSYRLFEIRAHNTVIMKTPIRVLFFLAALSVVAIGENPAETPAARELRKSNAEIAKTVAETEKLNAEAANFRNAPWFSIVQYIFGLAAIVTPIVIAIKQIGEQRELQRMRARVDASLKAAEIAMNAPATDQVHARTKMLAALLQELVPDFGKKLKTRCL